MKKFIAIFLAFTVIVSGAFISAGASTEQLTECNGECEYYPTIIIPGLGQSNVWLLDDNGEFVLDADGNKTAVFPGVIDLGSIIKTAIGPLLLSVITQSDMGFSDAVVDIINSIFGVNKCDEYGIPRGAALPVNDNAFAYNVTEHIANNALNEIRNTLPVVVV